MIIDNTNRMFPVAQPRSFLATRSYRGLSGLGNTETSFFGMTMQDLQQLVAGLNSQQLFQLNLQRAQQGLPPLSTQVYAPAVNIGMSPEMQKMVMIGGLALLAVLLLKKRA